MNARSNGETAPNPSCRAFVNDGASICVPSPGVSPVGYSTSTLAKELIDDRIQRVPAAARRLRPHGRRRFRAPDRRRQRLRVVGEPDRARAYGRDGNPTWEALEQALGAIEDARALVFSSGQAASMALMLALTEGRERLVMPADGYFSTRTLANRLRPNGVEPVYVDLQDLAQVERELAAGPSVLWAETPTNPLLRVADLARLGELAAAAGAPMAADNTVATGVLQQPLSWGSTASLYSLTKGASGHADVILGAVVTRDDGLLEKVLAWRDTAGGVAGPFEAWLALRGLRTLAFGSGTNPKARWQSPTTSRPTRGSPRSLPGIRACDASRRRQADAGWIRAAALVRGGGRGGRGGRDRGRVATDPPGDQLRRLRVDLGEACTLELGDGARVADPPLGRARAGGGPDRRRRVGADGSLATGSSRTPAPGAGRRRGRPARKVPPVRRMTSSVRPASSHEQRASSAR